MNADELKILESVTVTADKDPDAAVRRKFKTLHLAHAAIQVLLGKVAAAEQSAAKAKALVAAHQSKPAAASAQVVSKVLTRAGFDALPDDAKSDFFETGGRVVD